MRRGARRWRRRARPRRSDGAARAAAAARGSPRPRRDDDGAVHVSDAEAVLRLPRIEEAHAGDVARLDLAQRLRSAEPGVVEVDDDVAIVLDRVRAALLEPERVQPLDELVDGARADGV